MAQLTEQQMGVFNQTLQQDPNWQAAMQLPPAQRTQAVAAAMQAVSQSMFGVPINQIENIEHYAPSGDSGLLERRGWIRRHPHISAAIVGGSAGAGGAGIAALGSGGGGAAAGGGVAAAGGAGSAAAGGGAAAGTAGALGSTSLATGSAAAGAGGLGVGAAMPAAGVAGGGLAGGVGATAGSFGAAGGPVAAGGGSGLSSSAIRQGLSAGGRGLSAAAQASANNRGTALDAAMEQDRTHLAARRDQRDSESDAWRKLSHAGYVSNWQQPEARFSPYTRPIAAPSDAQRTAAAMMEEEMMKRLREPRFQPTDVSQYARAGRGENAMGLIGAGLSAYDAYRGER